MKKKTLGQFFTTNYKYILQNLFIPDYVKCIIEPFCGNKDLLGFIKSDYTLELYDIDPKHPDITKQDTINNPPDYTNKFVLTNPPYLARNKSVDKKLFDKYNVNDLYKCLIKELITNNALGGILIIPLNFWSSIRKNDIELRRDFLSQYHIVCLNIFEEQVFEDTSYTVCAFQFETKTKLGIDMRPVIFNKRQQDIMVYPSRNLIKMEFSEENNFMVGGEIYKLPSNSKYTISRLTSKNVKSLNTNMVIKCIDDSKDNQIRLMFVPNKDIYIDNTPNQSARTYATLIIEPKIDIDTQKLLVEQFNDFLSKKRTEYNSLFLTNYRESKDIARKRISFDLVYDIVKHLLSKID